MPQHPHVLKSAASPPGSVDNRQHDIRGMFFIVIDGLHCLDPGGVSGELVARVEVVIEPGGNKEGRIQAPFSLICCRAESVVNYDFVEAGHSAAALTGDFKRVLARFKVVVPEQRSAAF